MSTSTQTPNEPAAVPSSRSFKPRDAMNCKAWIAKAAKQPMVLETVDLGPVVYAGDERDSMWCS